MTHCLSPHHANPAILCQREAGHRGELADHACPNPGNGSAIVWPRSREEMRVEVLALLADTPVRHLTSAWLREFLDKRVRALP